MSRQRMVRSSKFSRGGSEPGGEAGGQPQLTHAAASAAALEAKEDDDPEDVGAGAGERGQQVRTASFSGAPAHTWDRETDINDRAMRSAARRTGYVLLAMLDVWQSAVGDHVADEEGGDIYNTYKAAADTLLHIADPKRK